MSRVTPAGVLAAGWGVLGLLATLVEAIYRLWPLALEPVERGMGPALWAVYVGFAVLNGWLEGYRGFQRRFAPRAVARAALLVRRPGGWRSLLAPLFVMALVDATRRRLIANWLLVVGIVLLVLGVRTLPQPARGIIDAGVVVGLTWGTLSVVWFLGRLLAGRPAEVDPELGPSVAAGQARSPLRELERRPV